MKGKAEKIDPCRGPQQDAIGGGDSDLVQFWKGVLVDGDGHYLFIGFTEKEIDLAKNNPLEFKAWLILNEIN